MSDYEKWSDHEINKKVTVIVNNLHGWELSGSNMSFYHCGIDGNCWEECEVIDYCNNPLHAFPLINKHRISIYFYANSKRCIASFNAGRRNVRNCSGGEKSLRAAIICFLRLKDAEND